MNRLWFLLKAPPWNALILVLATLIAASWFDSHSGFFSVLRVTAETAGSAIESRTVPEFPAFNWSIAFAFGILLGSFPAALLSGDFKPEFQDRSGGGLRGVASTALRGVVGGFLLVTGFQLAGGSIMEESAAAMNLSTGAWIFLAALAVTGVLLSVLYAGSGGGGGAEK